MQLTSTVFVFNSGKCREDGDNNKLGDDGHFLRRELPLARRLADDWRELDPLKWKIFKFVSFIL